MLCSGVVPSLATLPPAGQGIGLGADSHHRTLRTHGKEGDTDQKLWVGTQDRWGRTGRGGGDKPRPRGQPPPTQASGPPILTRQACPSLPPSPGPAPSPRLDPAARDPSSALTLASVTPRPAVCRVCQPGCPSLEKNFCRPSVRDQGPRLPSTPHGHPRCAALRKGPQRVRLEPGRPGVRGRPAGGLTSVARPSPRRRRGPRPWPSAVGARRGCRGPSPCPTRPPRCRA